MPHSYNKIWIHAIWSTKKRLPFITPDIEKPLFQFLANEFRESGCPVRIINGMPDHIHCLFLLNPKKSIAEIMKQIKGSSSHYINEQNLSPDKFAWQTGYAAYSVSESVLDKAFRYIKNQKQHHQHKAYQNEFEACIKLHHYS